MSEAEVQNTQNQSRHIKKRDPITINLADVIKTTTEKQQKKEKNVIKKKKVYPNEALPLNPANILDSSGPKRQYGKKRENQKPKKPTALKSVILQERETKKNQNIENSNSEISETTSTDPTINLLINAKDVIHSRNFRNYCDHLLMEEINSSVTRLLKDLVKFQERVHHENPIKAHIKRRYVLGFKETLKYLTYNKLKLIIIAPNLENIASKGGVNDLIEKMKRIANEKKVPYVFSLNRKNLGNLAHKTVPTSVIGILNYSGSEENYKMIKNLISQARDAYKLEIIRVLESFSKVTVDTENNNTPSIDDETTQNENIRKDINEQVNDSFLSLLIDTIKGSIKVEIDSEDEDSEFLKAIQRCSLE